MLTDALCYGHHEIFSKIDNMTGHKTSLNRFKMIEIIPSMFSEHKVKKQEINNKKKEKNTQVYGN